MSEQPIIRIHGYPYEFDYTKEPDMSEQIKDCSTCEYNSYENEYCSSCDLTNNYKESKDIATDKLRARIDELERANAILTESRNEWSRLALLCKNLDAVKELEAQLKKAEKYANHTQACYTTGEDCTCGYDEYFKSKGEQK